MILNALSRGEDVENLNITLLLLIPKSKNPKNMRNYKPASLCWVQDDSKRVGQRVKKNILDAIIFYTWLRLCAGKTNF